MLKRRVNNYSQRFSISLRYMDHASELEVVPLSSGIDDIERLHKARAHPFTPLDIQQSIRKRLNSHKNDTEKDKNKNDSNSQSAHNFIRVIAPSIGFFGCQFAWACQGGYVDPYLRQLGLPDDMMNYAWILGPISGIYCVCTRQHILAHSLFSNNCCCPDILCTFGVSECLLSPFFI